jgi:hypothetical protein
MAGRYNCPMERFGISDVDSVDFGVKLGLID